MPNAIMHFEIPADDVERAKAFYAKVFGWRFESYPAGPGEDEYFMVMAKDGDNGINGGLMKRKMPGQPFTNYVTVESIEHALAAAQSSGARVALPKQEIGGGMGWIAAFLDPENNLIGLHQIGANMPRPAVAKKPAKKAARKAASRPAAKKAAAKKAAAMKPAAKKPAKKAKRSAKKRG
jgi:uncharacterized protein